MTSVPMWTGPQYRFRRFRTIDTTDMPNDQWVKFSNWVESYDRQVTEPRQDAQRHGERVSQPQAALDERDAHRGVAGLQ